MNLIVQCGGGLCNRINNLINGIYLSEFLNRKLYVWWDLNNACQCPLDKLFSNEFNKNHQEAYTEEFVYYSPFHTENDRKLLKNKYGERKYRPLWKYDDYTNSYNRSENELNKNSSIILSELKAIKSPTLIFSSSLILTEIIPESFVIKILGELSPVKELSDRIDSILKSNNINHSVIGVHLRKTDYNLLDDNEVKNSINKYLEFSDKNRFLICSDSEETEIEFKKTYPNNVIVIGGKSLIEKINDKITDREFSNLIRTEESVKSALVDMYLLGHTSFSIFSPISTFAQTIFRLSKIDYKLKNTNPC